MARDKTTKTIVLPMRVLGTPEPIKKKAKRKATTQKPKPPRRFVVSLEAARGEKPIVRGRRYELALRHPDYCANDYCEVMTQEEARKAVHSRASLVIFELVPVEPSKKGAER